MKCPYCNSEIPDEKPKETDDGLPTLKEMYDSESKLLKNIITDHNKPDSFSDDVNPDDRAFSD